MESPTPSDGVVEVPVVDEDSENEDGEYSVLKALKNPTTFINFWAVIVCFCVISFNYYMVSFYLKYAGGNIFINSILSVVSESISNFVAGAVQKVFGTKWSMLVCFIFALIFAVPLLFVTTPIIIAICVFSSKFFVEGSFMLIYYVNSEVFPPLFVPFAFSISGFGSRVVTIAAPQVAEIRPRQVPIIIF